MPIRKSQIIMHELNGVGIKQREFDGYFDASAMCEVSERDFEEYLDLRKTKSFLIVLSEELNLPKTQLIRSKNTDGEIWMHPQVAINFAQWASPQLAVMIPLWVFEWMKSKTSETTPKRDFENIDPEFTSWIEKAAKFDPRKN
jgi:hypothetical protein